MILPIQLTSDFKKSFLACIIVHSRVKQIKKEVGKRKMTKIEVNNKKKKVKKIVRTVVIALLIFAVLGSAIGSFIVGKMVRDGVLYQNKDKDTKGNSFKQMEVWGYDYNKFLKEHKGTDFNVKGKDGVNIPGTYYMADEANDRYVIIAHGAGGERNCVLPVVEIFLRNNINAVTYDQRGSGDSEDPCVTFGIKEKNDVECLVDFVKKELKAKEVYVLGQSMGGATVALYAATEHAKENVDVIILDSPVPGMELTLKYMFMENYGMDETSAEYIIDCGSLYSKIIDKMSFKEGDTIEKMKDNRCKTLVILSEQDEICLPSDVENLYNNIVSDEKELVRLDNSHIEGSIRHIEEYESALMNFINK